MDAVQTKIALKPETLIPKLPNLQLINKAVSPAILFKQLKNSDIERAFVYILPEDVYAELDNNEISELISLLNESKTYLKDDSYGEYYGQSITYTIIKKDKTKIEIKPFNPFLIIDGNGFITDYNNCEELQQLGNNIAGIK